MSGLNATSPTHHQSDTGMAWTPMDIAIIAGELSRDPSSNQEGQRKCPGKKPPEDSGVITTVAFVLVSLLLLMLHYMYRHKGTYHTNEAKGTEFAESADAALQGDPSLQETGDSSRKEYFI
ncbi:glycophorin-C isoform X1 [Pteropus medius]|uniref:Glycophorin-C isoform X1 n=1 Tax=Pteropus vampyrus TaxID=132908 RepID=A0A6P6CLT4_PTEVA|nr:glycophorin-C isoform X1 [Pteropus vampyrus]XP_039706709.1 glycophorin-C isoform X1 [Pteropus giganteus]